MSEETPESAYEPTGLVEFIGQALAEGFARFESDLGAQFLGDWIIVAEVHTEKDAVLRIASSENTPVWRQQMLVTFASEDLKNDMLIYRLTQAQEEE